MLRRTHCGSRPDTDVGCLLRSRLRTGRSLALLAWSEVSLCSTLHCADVVRPDVDGTCCGCDEQAVVVFASFRVSELQQRRH